VVGRTCGTSRDSCHAQLSINHRPLDRFGYVTFWIRLDDSLLSVGVLVGRSAARRRSIEFARWSPTPSRRLSTTVRYIAVSNELSALSFALYRDVDVNTCYVNETVALRTQSTQQSLTVTVITFRVRRSRGEMYSGHGRLCVCLSVPRCIPALLHGPGCTVTWENDMGCPLVVHYWADLQSVYGFRCSDNIAPNEKCQRVLVLALCLDRIAIINQLIVLKF